MNVSDQTDAVLTYLAAAWNVVLGRRFFGLLVHPLHIFLPHEQRAAVDPGFVLRARSDGVLLLHIFTSSLNFLPFLDFLVFVGFTLHCRGMHGRRVGGVESEEREDWNIPEYSGIFR